MTGALPVDAPTDATTLHGWLAEFIAVAAKRPVAVTAPQPPLTDQLTVAPVGWPLTVNCWVDPTWTDADDGDSVSPITGVGVVLIWKYPSGRSSAPVAMTPTSPKKVVTVPAGVPVGTVKS